MMYRNLALAIALLPLSACASNDVTMGGALRHDIALQTIDPEPAHAGTPMEGGDGERAARAVAAYRKGTVKQPATLNTTAIIGNSSGTTR